MKSSLSCSANAPGLSIGNMAEDRSSNTLSSVSAAVASSKLPGRAPPSHALLRLFFRPTPEQLRDESDAEWVLRAERCAALAFGPLVPAERAWVSRWDRALPVFDAAHRARVSALEAALVGSGVLLAGAAFHGAGIDGAVRSAEAAALGLSALTTSA